jgi:hypothetical protein
MVNPKELELGKKAQCKWCGQEIEVVLFHNSNTPSWIHINYTRSTTQHSPEPLDEFLTEEKDAASKSSE